MPYVHLRAQVFLGNNTALESGMKWATTAKAVGMGQVPVGCPPCSTTGAG